MWESLLRCTAADDSSFEVKTAVKASVRVQGEERIDAVDVVVSYI